MSSYSAMLNGQSGELFVHVAVDDQLLVRFIAYPDTEVRMEIDVTDAREILRKILESK